jgi:mRNA-degrading endonuclease RelE of RelBE toxin-antitoxin system
LPKYKVIAHRRIYKFLNELTDQVLKNTFKEHITKLEDYPLSLREMDTEKIRGAKNTFSLRIGGYRVIFFVDNTEGTVYVTLTEARKKAYAKTG